MSQEEISAQPAQFRRLPSGCTMRPVRRWLSVRRYRSTRSHRIRAIRSSDDSRHHHQNAVYQATWTRLDASRWELRFKNETNHVPVIVLRSVGPAGGPVTALNQEEGKVTVNHRWAVTAAPFLTALRWETKIRQGG